MKRANPSGPYTPRNPQVQTPRATNPTSRPSQGHARRPNAGGAGIGSVLKNLTNWLVRIITFPIQLFTWLTNPPGSAIALGLAVFYFALVNVEGYWQSIPAIANKIAFMPKPFIDDGGDLRNIFFALADTSFYMAALVSTVIQAVQALILREVSAEAAKANYEAVAQYKVPDSNPNSIDLAELRRKQFKKVGMRAARLKGVTFLVVYGIDICVAMWNFPILGLPSIGQLAINAVWLVLSVIGTELAINMFLDALEHTKAHHARRPEVL